MVLIIDLMLLSLWSLLQIFFRFYLFVDKAQAVLKTNNQLVQQQTLFLQPGYIITEVTEKNGIKSAPREK